MHLFYQIITRGLSNKIFRLYLRYCFSLSVFRKERHVISVNFDSKYKICSNVSPLHFTYYYFLISGIVWDHQKNNLINRIM